MFPDASGAPSLDIPGAPESALRVNPALSLSRLTSFRRRFSLRVAVRPYRINNDEAQIEHVLSRSFRLNSPSYHLDQSAGRRCAQVYFVV